MFNILKVSGRITSAAIFGLGLMFSVSAAQAATLSFSQITANGGTGGAAQLGVTYTDDTDGALFAFSVIAGDNDDLNVAEIYFDDRTPLFKAPMTAANIISQTGTDFTAGSANPKSLPGGNAVNWNTTAGLLADSAAGNTAGIQVGDELVLKLFYDGTFAFADLSAALTSGLFRMGMHVRSHDGGYSEGYVNNIPGGGVKPPSPPPVPLPAGLPLILTALGSLVAVGRRKSRKAA
ncbi:VPLPA-CTERM protein sorting domain-containing protein [Roseovarius marisflavi]|uniref:VPLPA-CTERM protein sorting domain-containing protein n=1 Tax=Roseovarius marisflavi TaxID=1054996 RepID=A0A1M7CH71_9RHOB|nr:VPLPA-CTERM sorting domain-containing protein [Roseovarius marisflavi]SHL66618.1 VPLPA-CTERM protein sorting domain-containing protein [Roseovarius marisflavi]